MSKFLHFAVALLLFQISVQAQTPWRSKYYPENWKPPVDSNFYTDAFLQDYSYAGYQYGEKALTIPSLTVYDVTKAPYNADKTGTNDATSAIQSAIDAAQNNEGGVVYLPAGTYKINPGAGSQALRISKSNTYLKGDGVGKTYILNTSYEMNNKSIIKVTGSASWTNLPSTKAMLTADVMKPVNVISVDNTSLFAVGDLIIVRNVVGDDWINEHKMANWLGYGNNLRGLMYCRYITAIDAVKKTITLDVPIRYALKTRDGACAFKLSGMISEVGLSDFSIGNVQNPATSGFGEDDYNTAGTAGYNSHASYVINYNAVINGWMKNVSTYQPVSNTTKSQMLSNGLLFQYCKNVTADNCTMRYAQYGGGGGNGYAFRVSANEVLISNSTSSNVRHGFVFSSMWCSGNVYLKCKDITSGFQCGNTGSMTTSGYGSDHHMHFSQSNLIDNCYTEGSAFYAYYRPYGGNPMHGVTSTHTAFWNISSGGTKPLCVWTQQGRYGYAIGTSGTASSVYTKENSTGTASITNPVDITEGVGDGATLVPQSLYLDQLAKRTTGSNVAPTCIITAPANHSVFASPATINITATATDSDGSVSKVEFYNGNSLLQSDATFPYSYSWPNVAPGTYIITAVATDNKGATTTSLADTIEVIDAASCVQAKASADDGNVATNVLDKDLITRWSANGDGQYIEFCLNDTLLLTGVSVAFYSGNVRTSTFDVLYTLDGLNWTEALKGKVSSGTSLALETFNFAVPVEAWKVRIVGHGNSVNMWNSFTEVEFNSITTGITSNKPSTVFRVYPNPAADMLIVEKLLGINEKSSVLLFNSIGQEVFEASMLHQAQLNINLSTLPSGMYYLRVDNSVEKIIVNK
ncbi:MAG: Ig-like domain-containing protein [Flavobacteriales bacterium]